jgi:hypothetical protein
MPSPSSVLVQNPLSIQTLKSPALSEQPFGDVLEYRISATMLWLCTVDIRERRAHFLPISTYVIFKGSDILKPSKGCCGRQPRDKNKVCRGRRTRNSLLQNLLKRILPHGSALPDCGAFF